MDIHTCIAKIRLSRYTTAFASYPYDPVTSDNLINPRKLKERIQ
jgi:hypothetical protein